jgi:hypothetical protein
VAVEIGQAHKLERAPATGRELKARKLARLLVLLRGDAIGLDGRRKEWLSKQNAEQTKTNQNKKTNDAEPENLT